MAQSRPDVQQPPHGLSRHELLEHLRAVSAYLPGFIYQLCLSPIGHFYFTFTSTGLESIFGVTQKRLIEDASLLLKKIHSNDYQRLINENVQHIETGKTWHNEFRML
ncbi:hypothetical protein [Methylophaga pinxianii]|uniref:hypothetical protein n=1 Tax=Methylophaga pinxianii TaxID=2881052 RepID=UPI001CF1B5E5|nr:hypothetical protein [Methylophaga pinxianii]MCB2428029.1 hypothetical protein [Methylophaga pinxianii]UPH46093.1 hypothetical protein LGT42_002090 [Methylophaga pinxianii]